MVDEPILRMPGEWLAEARQSAGLTLAEVSERTKVPLRMLQSIERDEYHKLSGPLYVKSFLRAYAVEVGLEVEEILDLYGRMTGATTESGQAVVPQEERVTISRVGVPWVRITAMGVAGAAVVVALVLFVRGCGGSSVEQSPAAGDVSSPVVVAAANDSPPQAVVAEVAPGAVLADTLAGGWLAEAPREDAVEKQLPRAVAAAVTDLPQAVAGDGTTVFAGGRRWPVVLRLLCTEPVAVQVRADGDAVFTAADFAAPTRLPSPATGLVPGRAYAVRGGYVVYWGAADHFGLKLGRTDGVTVAVNGRAAEVSRLRPGREKILDALR